MPEVGGSFRMSVNPIWTKGGRLCPPYYYMPLHLFSDDAASLKYICTCTHLQHLYMLSINAQVLKPFFDRKKNQNRHPDFFCCSSKSKVHQQVIVLSYFQLLLTTRWKYLLIVFSGVILYLCWPVVQQGLSMMLYCA